MTLIKPSFDSFSSDLYNFPPNSVYNIVSCCRDLYTFVLRTNSIGFYNHKTNQSPIYYAIEQTRTLSPIFLRTNCDGTVLMLLTKYFFGIIRFNPNSVIPGCKILKVNIIPKNDLDYTQIIDARFFETDPNQLVMARKGGIIEVFKIIHKDNIVSIRSVYKLATGLKLSSIKFGIDSWSQYSLFLLTKDGKLFVLCPFLSQYQELPDKLLQSNSPECELITRACLNHGNKHFTQSFFAGNPQLIAPRNALMISSFDFEEGCLCILTDKNQFIMTDFSIVPSFLNTPNIYLDVSNSPTELKSNCKLERNRYLFIMSHTHIHRISPPINRTLLVANNIIGVGGNIAIVYPSYEILINPQEHYGMTRVDPSFANNNYLVEEAHKFIKQYKIAEKKDQFADTIAKLKSKNAEIIKLSEKTNQTQQQLTQLSDLVKKENHRDEWEQLLQRAQGIRRQLLSKRNQFIENKK